MTKIQSNNNSKGAKTFRYGFILSLVVLGLYIFENLHILPINRLSFQFRFLFIYLCLVVLLNRNTSQAYLIPLKVLGFATILLIPLSILYLIFSSEKMDLVEIVNNIGTGLPNYISSIIIYLVSSILPLIISTIIGIAVNKRSTTPAETLDDHLT